MDLSVLATPFYFASMAAERRVLQRRAARIGPTAADYQRDDTRTSLTMGVGSLLTPLSAALLARVVPGRRRAGTALVGATVAAVAVTTVADLTVRRIDARDAAPGVATADRARRRRAARRVAEIGGVATVVGAGLAACAASAHLGSTRRQWERWGRRRDLGGGWRGWAAALVGWDLVYYWNHRLMHEVRALWAVHVPHHSSERYNLGTALRQPVASAFGVWVPYGWLARLGVRPSLIEHSRAINLIYQFWIHTDTVRTLGAAEEVLNTPSHHRVHHGSNRRYLDRNHGGILVVWDRLFGTFQRERADDPVVYGLTTNVGTFDPWTVATHEYRAMFGDVAASTTWRDRLSFVLRGPGWAHDRRRQLALSTAG